MSSVELVCDESHRGNITIVKTKTLSNIKVNYNTCTSCKNNSDFEDFKEIPQN